MAKSQAATPIDPLWRGAATMASGAASAGQLRAALAVVFLAVALTGALLPAASRTWLVMPGFMLVHGTALVVIYALGTWMLLTQYMRSGLATLLLAAGGTLFTDTVVALQLFSSPGVMMPGSAFGAGSPTVAWLWMAWHVGPPIWGLAAAALLTWRRDMAVAPRLRLVAAAGAAGFALALAGGCAGAATVLLPWLPRLMTGDDYGAVLATGVGPGVEALTIVALAAMAWATRRQRSTLDVWIMAALALLALDNVLTLAGGARGSVGWLAGRMLSLASGCAVIWAYLHEVDSLRARAEAAFDGLAATEARLRSAQKMEAVGRLTGGIAHDFNNLLMVVTSGFDMIRRRPDDRARVVKMAEAGLLATERGARLTRQLLTFARGQSLRPETVNPNAQLLAFEPLACRAAGDAIKLSFTLDASAFAVQMDTAEFQAAVLNLVANGREALAPRGGQITISSRNAALAAPSGAVGLPAGDYVVIAVADDGPGMSPEIAARVFEPFFTTKDFGAGSGLGLSQVYGFVRSAAGEAVIHTAPGQGATVELWLPRASPDHPAVADARDHDTPLRAAQSGEVVLAVEDEPDVLAAVVESLADLGYQVVAARDAEEALERLRGTDRVDLLFSDVVMPGGMNGVQLATLATRLRPRLRVLLTSGYTNHALEGRHDLPAHLDILPKPYRRAELASRLQLVMRAA